MKEPAFCLADLLERAAFVIRTRCGEKELADQLAKAAKYHRPNPLGGPAVLFEGCADAIRAGDSIEAAMKDFGLRWR